MYLKLTIFCLLVITLNTLQAQDCKSGYPQACQATLDFIQRGLSKDEIKAGLLKLFVVSKGCWPYNIVAADDEEDLKEDQKEAQVLESKKNATSNQAKNQASSKGKGNYYHDNYDYDDGNMDSSDSAIQQYGTVGYGYQMFDCFGSDCSVDDDKWDFNRKLDSLSNPLRLDQILDPEDLKILPATNKSKRTFWLETKGIVKLVDFYMRLLGLASDSDKGDTDKGPNFIRTNDPIGTLEKCSKFESPSFIDLLYEIQLLIRAQQQKKRFH